MRNNENMGSQREGRRNQYNDESDRDRQGLRTGAHDSSYESYDDDRVTFSRDRDWRMNQGASISGPMGGGSFRNEPSQEFRQGNRGQSFREDYGSEGGYDRSYGPDSGWGSRSRGLPDDYGGGYAGDRNNQRRGPSYGTQGSYSQNYGQQGYAGSSYGNQGCGSDGRYGQNYGRGYDHEQGRGGDYYGERGMRGQGGMSGSYGGQFGPSGQWGQGGSGSSTTSGTHWGSGTGMSGSQWGSGTTGGSNYGSPNFKKGPKGYKRSDERIKEDVCDRLAALDHVDSSDIEVQVVNGEVTLTGTVPNRNMKWEVEQRCDSIGGVKDVTNNLRVKRESDTESDTSRTNRTTTTSQTAASQNGENDRKSHQARS